MPQLCAVIDRENVTRVAVTPTLAGELLTHLTDETPRFPGIRRFSISTMFTPEPLRRERSVLRGVIPGQRTFVAGKLHHNQVRHRAVTLEKLTSACPFDHELSPMRVYSLRSMLSVSVERILVMDLQLTNDIRHHRVPCLITSAPLADLQSASGNSGCSCP